MNTVLFRSTLGVASSAKENGRSTAAWSLREAHEVGGVAKTNLPNQFPSVLDVTIRMEPFEELQRAVKGMRGS